MNMSNNSPLCWLSLLFRAKFIFRKVSFFLCNLKGCILWKHFGKCKRKSLNSKLENSMEHCVLYIYFVPVYCVHCKPVYCEHYMYLYYTTVYCVHYVSVLHYVPVYYVKYVPVYSVHHIHCTCEVIVYTLYLWGCCVHHVPVIVYTIREVTEYTMYRCTVYCVHYVPVRLPGTP